MRKKHELEHGVICEHCLHIIKNKNYKRINTLIAIKSDTTGRFKTIDRVNLCDQCYETYKNLISEFIRVED